MELTFMECRKILNTLPTGYYCGRKVPTELDKTADTSFYSMLTDTITISFLQIAKAVEKCAEEANKETAVRSMLYHELSHAILTPTNMYNNHSSKSASDETIRDILNIFEDERIETLLGDYYMDVNFKRQTYNMNGLSEGEIPPVDVNDPRDIFYTLVRFRYGEPDLLKEVRDIITKYSAINRNTEFYSNNGTASYVTSIIKLWDKINKRVTEKATADMKQDKRTLKKLLDSVDKSKPCSKSAPTDEEGEGEGEPIDGATPAVGKGTLTSKQAQELAKRVLSNKAENNPNLTPTQREQLAKARKAIEILIANFNRKNSGGNGYNAYSGIFNSRSTARDDYKYFDRIAQANGNNTFGTCHLSLVIDKSGSFYRNDNIVNAFLIMLSDIERKTPNFSLDVAFINTQFQRCKSVNDRRIKSGGGNCIPENITALLNDMQKPNSYNYTIILFDGDAMSDDWDKRSEKIARFRKLDRPNTCLITDEDNEKYIPNGQRFRKTKVIVTSEYANKLIENVVSAFHKMFS